MRRSLQLAYFQPRPGLRCVWALEFLVCAAAMSLVCPLRAQSSLPAAGKTQSASVTLPNGPSSARAVFNPMAAPAAPAPDQDAEASSIGERQAQLQPSQGDFAANAPQWSRSMLDPFEPGANFGRFTGSANVGIGFNGGFGARRLGPGGFNQFGASATSGRQGNRPYAFQLNDDFTRSSSGGAMAPFDAAPGTVPSFNQLMRGTVSMPLSSSVGGFRFFYQGRVGSGSNGTGLDFNRMIATGMYSSPDLGNGMHFSAGSNYNGHYLPGTPAVMKHNGPSVAIKLQF